MALTVFIGFGPTFYLRSYFGAPVLARELGLEESSPRLPWTRA
jgi:hypothetical protein